MRNSCGQTAERGEIEAVWLELCLQRSYAQIERLVSLTGYGQLPEQTFHWSAEARGTPAPG